MNIGRVLNLVVRAYSGGAMSVFMGLGYMLGSLANKANATKIALIAMGAAVAFMGIQTIKGLGSMAQAAAAYDTAIRRVYTLTEVDGPIAFAKMKESVLDLTRTIPKFAEEMATALYDIKTVVDNDRDALVMLEAASKAASLEMGETEPVAKAITSLYQVYGKNVKNVSKWTDQLTMAVSVGRAEYSDYAAALGPVLAYGNQLGSSFQEQAGILSFLTRKGFQANQAATQMRNTMMKIINPAKLARDEYRKLGIEWGEKGVKAAGGLIPWLQKLMDKTGGNSEELRKFFPNLRALPMLLTLAKDKGKDLGYVMDQLGNSTGTLNERFARAMEGFDNQKQIMVNAFSELKIRIGNVLLPVLANIIQKITPLIQRMSEWVEKNPELTKKIVFATAAIAAMAVVVGTLVAGIGAFLLVKGALVATAAAAGAAGSTATVSIGLFSRMGMVLKGLGNILGGKIAGGFAAVIPFIGKFGSGLFDAFSILTIGGRGVSIAGANKNIAGITKVLVAIGRVSKPIANVGWAFKSLFTRISESGGIVSFIGKSIAGIGPKVLGMGGAFTKILNPIKLAMVAMQNPFGAIAKLLPIISGGLTGAFSAVGAAIGSAVAAVAPFLLVIAAIAGVAYVVWKYWDKVKAVFSTTSPFVQGLIDVFKPFIAQIKEQGMPLWNALKDLWVQLKPVLVAVGAVIGAVLVVALGLLVGILAGVGGALAGLIQAIRGVIQVISGVVGIIVNAFKFLWGVITGNKKLQAEALKGMAKSWAKLKEGIVNTFKGLWSAVKGLVIGFVKGVVNFFVGLYYTLVGHSIIPDMIKAIIKWWLLLPLRIFSIVAGLAKNVVKWFITIGSNISAGIKEGLRNTWNGLVNKLRSLVNLLPAAVKKLLKIQSPSKVFEALGAMLPAGLAEGIAGNTSAAVAAVTNMANSLNPALTPSYAMKASTTVTVVHQVEFGNLPPNIKVDMTGKQVADLIRNDEKAVRDLGRTIDIVTSRSNR